MFRSLLIAKFRRLLFCGLKFDYPHAPNPGGGACRNYPHPGGGGDERPGQYRARPRSLDLAVAWLRSRWQGGGSGCHDLP